MLRPTALAIGEVPPEPAIADEAPALVECRQPRHGHVTLAAVGGGARKLEVPEWEMSVQRGPVLAPSLFVGLDVGDLPAGLADLGSGRRCVGEPFGELLRGEAWLGAGSP